MNIKLDIGPEILKEDGMPVKSSHLLNLKNIDKFKKDRAHEDVSIDLKEEIKSQKTSSGRICIIGEVPADKNNLGRISMIVAAVFIIMMLNLGQLLFLGRSKGEEALALAAEAFTTLELASKSAVSGEENADLIVFDEAERLFAEAEEKSKFLLSYNSDWLAEPSLVRSLRNLLDSGGLMAKVGSNLSEAKSKLLNAPKEGSLTDYISQVSLENLEPAYYDLKTINEKLMEVDLSDTNFNIKFIEYREKIKDLSLILKTWMDSKEAILTALGARYPQHYLVLLMNNDEMRPGGGFIGSLLLLELNDGRLEDYEFHDVYEYDGIYHERNEMPLHEMRVLTDLWELRDANISPDFTYSALKAAWFLEQEGGPGVDGIIGVNLSSAQAMLEVTGPITVPSLSKPISAETLPTVMSTLVESKYYGVSSPKEILNEFILSFLQKTKQSDIKAKLGAKLMEEASKKQILFYHKFPEVQALIENFGFSGGIPKLSELNDDFFMPVFTNIGGNKADRYMSTEISHNTEILSDGGLVGELTIKRSHTFTESTLEWLKKTTAEYGFTKWNQDLEKVMGNSESRTAIRIYLPEGVQILSTSGILRDELQFYYDSLEEISYYFVDQKVQPGQSETFTITYSLPWTFSGDFNEYNFQVFKQPGLKNVKFTKTVTSEKTMLSSYPLPTSSFAEHDYFFENNFENDFNVKLLYQ